MTKPNVDAARQYLPALLVLFVGSGCAALIYEIVWFHLLELVIGSSAISLGVLLGTFMGGMCLGSFLLPRFISDTHHPLRVYAFIELGIGAIGLIVLFGMPLIGAVYTTLGLGSGFVSILLRSVIAGVCLLPPTLLMGATLPAIARWVETTPRGVAWLGFFYGGNICGAVIGSLLAGYYLLRVYDVWIATFAAVAINVAVALLSLGIAKTAAYAPPAASKGEAAPAPSGVWPVYVAIALSGMTALAAEVIWTRLLTLLIGATVYAFSLILAVFLFGLGIGSSLGSALAGRVARPRVALAWCQLLLCVGIAWTAYVVNVSLPFWPVDVTLPSTPWLSFQLNLVRCLWAALPPAILWGASFPLALAAVARPGQDPARLVGGVYAANTVGAIVGALGASLLLVAWIGSQAAQQVLVLISGISALLAAFPALITKEGRKAKLQPITLILVAAAAVWVALLVRAVPPLQERFVQYGRFAPTRGAGNTLVYVGEGINATVAVSRNPEGILNYHNAGKVQASSHPSDMRLQRMLGHLTTLLPKNPRSMLVIGCGAGVTAGAVSIDPRTERVIIAEIEPLVPSVVSTYFGEHNFNVIRNPKVQVRIDDGRHFLMTTNEKFDGITSDPLDPWVKGAAALYTKEFFEVAKAHLNPGGVVTQFVQLYESNEEAVKSEIATFFEVFPNGIVWANTVEGKGYDLALLGTADPIQINIDEIQERLRSADYAPVAKSLSEVGMFSAIELFSAYGGRAADLRPWMQGADINRDYNLRLQYLAGMGLNLYQAEGIYLDMQRYIKFPDDLFTGSQPLIDTLRRNIASSALQPVQ
jgi:spermidine synthase